MQNHFSNSIYKHIEVINSLLPLETQFTSAARSILNCLDSGGKIIIAGNGGSAADAQHIAAEFTGRFVLERQALPAIALSTDTSALTAIGNDYGFEYVFSRQVEALGNSNDLLILISTSGNSSNLINAVNIAKLKGIPTIALLGKDGGELLNIVDKSIVVNSRNTARIQEAHIMLAHIFCEIVDNHIDSFTFEV